jgi:hypothetical protein
VEATLEELQRQYDEYKVCKPEIWNRTIGYYRPTNQWNPGLLEANRLRVTFKLLGD